MLPAARILFPLTALLRDHRLLFSLTALLRDHLCQLFNFASVNVSVNGQTFIEWYIEDYFFGPTGAGNPKVIGFYVDDFWGQNGANEMDSHHLVDLGFTQADVDAQVAAFTWASAIVYSETIKRGKFIWDQFLNHDPYGAQARCARSTHFGGLGGHS